MPFNGSGVFTRLYSWVTDRDAGTKIIADRVDAETDGIVAGLNSVVDGTQGFIGTVKAPSGTVAAPAHSFTTDTDSGMYRASEDVLGFAVNGTLEGQFEAGFFDAVNGLKIGGTEVTATAAELNYVDGVTSNIQTQLDAKEPADADILKANTHDTLAAGFDSSVEALGTITSGTVTPEVDDDDKPNIKTLTANGAFTLAPPSTSNACTIMVQVTNGASAGAITTSGFTIVNGDTYETTSGNDYFFHIKKVGSFTSLTIEALQ